MQRSWGTNITVNTTRYYSGLIKNNNKTKHKLEQKRFFFYHNDINDYKMTSAEQLQYEPPK